MRKTALQQNEPINGKSFKNERDPVEMAMIGPYLQGESDAISKYEELARIGFNASYFKSCRMMRIWQQISQSVERGSFSREKLLSHILNDDFYDSDRNGRFLMIHEISKFGDSFHLTEHACELMERNIRNEIEAEIQSLKKHDGKTSEYLADLESKVLELQRRSVTAQKDEKIEAINELIDELGRAERGEIILRQSGVKMWDKAIGGLPDAQLIILAGRPGDSKTSLAEQIIDSMCRRGIGVLYIQRELSRTRAVGRIACRKAEVQWWKVERRCASSEENGRLKTELEKYRHLPLWLSPVSICNSQTVAPLIRFHSREYNIKLVVLDYVQLMNPPRGQERWVAIGELTAMLKRIANETGVTVVALAQLGRKKTDAFTKPTLSDLRESGNIEQDADVVGALWKDQDPEGLSVYPINFTILKQRNGSVGSFAYNFDGPTRTFLEEYKGDILPESKQEKTKSHKTTKDDYFV